MTPTLEKATCMDCGATIRAGLHVCMACGRIRLRGGRCPWCDTASVPVKGDKDFGLAPRGWCLACDERAREWWRHTALPYNVGQHYERAREKQEAAEAEPSPWQENAIRELEGGS